MGGALANAYGLGGGGGAPGKPPGGGGQNWARKPGGGGGGGPRPSRWGGRPAKLGTGGNDPGVPVGGGGGGIGKSGALVEAPAAGGGANEGNDGRDGSYSSSRSTAIGPAPLDEPPAVAGGGAGAAGVALSAAGVPSSSLTLAESIVGDEGCDGRGQRGVPVSEEGGPKAGSDGVSGRFLVQEA